MIMPFSGWLGSSAEEGRAKLRKASGRYKEPVNRGRPNENSRLFLSRSVRIGNALN